MRDAGRQEPANTPKSIKPMAAKLLPDDQVQDVPTTLDRVAQATARHRDHTSHGEIRQAPPESWQTAQCFFLPRSFTQS